MEAPDGEAAGASDVPDFEPPQACIQRVIKSVLPENAQIMKESKAAYSKAAGIFIIYVTTWYGRARASPRLSVTGDAAAAQRERLLQGEEAPDDHDPGRARGDQVRSARLGDRAAALPLSRARARPRLKRVSNSRAAPRPPRVAASSSSTWPTS